MNKKNVSSLTLIFESENKNIIIDSSMIFKILVQKKISPVPFAENGLLGFINYRNNIIPVFSVYEILFNKKEKLIKNNFNEYKIMVLSIDNQLTGFLVENIKPNNKDISVNDNSIFWDEQKIKNLLKKNYETEIY